MLVKLVKIHPKAHTPTRATGGSAGYDLCASLANPAWIRPGESVVIGTGIALEIPPGYEAQVRSRSGLARNHCVVVLNSPGTIDADYRGEIEIVLFNHHTYKDFGIEDGMRIAQLVFSRALFCDIEVVDKLSETERGSGGFGSTGK